MEIRQNDVLHKLYRTILCDMVEAPAPRRVRCEYVSYNTASNANGSACPTTRAARADMQLRAAVPVGITYKFQLGNFPQYSCGCTPVPAQNSTGGIVQTA